MDLISKLTPAETLLLLRPSEARLRDFMKYTFMDLLARKVLMLINYDQHPVQGNATLAFAYVKAGVNLRMQKPRLHEMIFLYPFYKKEQSKILFNHLVQMAYKVSKGEENFKTKLLLDGEMKALVKIGFWQRLTGSVKLNESGTKKSMEIIRHFNYLDRELPAMLKKQPERANELINEVKGNVLLLNALKFELLELIGREITRVEAELDGGS